MQPLTIFHLSTSGDTEKGKNVITVENKTDSLWQDS